MAQKSRTKKGKTSKKTTKHADLEVVTLGPIGPTRESKPLTAGFAVDCGFDAQDGYYKCS